MITRFTEVSIIYTDTWTRNCYLRVQWMGSMVWYIVLVMLSANYIPEISIKKFETWLKNLIATYREPIEVPDKHVARDI